jgi:PAS domain S-box-containing protein
MDVPSEDPADQAARLQRRVDGLTAALAAANEELDQERADRGRTEETLRARERFRTIVDDLPVMVTLMTPDGEFAEGNRHMLEYFGASLEELKRRPTTYSFHPDDRPGVDARWKESVETGHPYDFEARLRRGDGTYRWFHTRGFPLRDAEGRIVLWHLLQIDVDDRKQADEDLRRAYDSFAEAQRLSKTGSFITDLVGDEHSWSEEAYRIFDFDPATRISVQRIRDIIHQDDAATFESVIARGLTGVDVNFAFRIVTARGGVKHVRGVAHVIEHVAGRPMFVGALQDVTESMVAEEALNRARTELAHVSRVTTLSTLTASIAHEVSQPLSGVVTNASTCLRMLDANPPDVAGARETAKRAIRDGHRASDVITRLRALFSKRDFMLESLDLNDVTREVIALSLSELQRNRVILQSELAGDLPVITGDRVQLQQVILNLLRNASDAMSGVDDRPRQLLIRTEREGEDRARVTVRDAGVGIEREDMDKLFDAFHTTKSGGMGIGLSVSRSIVERHHGRLWAEPNDGPGATFAFSVPRSPEGLTQAAPS